MRFVVFNYDRCIEHFFIHALKRVFNISEDEAANIVGSLEIHHPYGVVGELSNAFGKGPFAPFGAPRAEYCNIATTKLKTYTETVDSNEIKKAVSAAEQVIFLGLRITIKTWHCSPSQVL